MEMEKDLFQLFGNLAKQENMRLCKPLGIDYYNDNIDDFFRFRPRSLELIFQGKEKIRSLPVPNIIQEKIDRILISKQDTIREWLDNEDTELEKRLEIPYYIRKNIAISYRPCLEGINAFQRFEKIALHRSKLTVKSINIDLDVTYTWCYVATTDYGNIFLGKTRYFKKNTTQFNNILFNTK